MKKVSQLIKENASKIIEASKNIPYRSFMYMDDDGNIGTCGQDHRPIGPYNILTSRPINSVDGIVSRYEEMEASM